MALQKHEADFRRLSPNEIEVWRRIPPAVASDCMNRTQAMHPAIKPVASSTPICGQARTVSVMPGDCWPVCMMISAARSGEIVVVDAAGTEEVAVWGGVMTEEARYRGLGGAVVDGAVRDIADIRRAGFAMYCRAATPRGPHQGFGGVIDGLVSAAGVPVRSGDIVLGDDDGVVVVPLHRANEVLAAAEEHLLKERDWIDQIRGGAPIPEIFSMKGVE